MAIVAEGYSTPCLGRPYRSITVNHRRSDLDCLTGTLIGGTVKLYQPGQLVILPPFYQHIRRCRRHAYSG
jgi:hypothetical protein